MYSVSDLSRCWPWVAGTCIYSPCLCGSGPQQQCIGHAVIDNEWLEDLIPSRFFCFQLYYHTKWCFFTCMWYRRDLYSKWLFILNKFPVNSQWFVVNLFLFFKMQGTKSVTPPTQQMHKYIHPPTHTHTSISESPQFLRSQGWQLHCRTNDPGADATQKNEWC